MSKQYYIIQVCMVKQAENKLEAMKSLAEKNPGAEHYKTWVLSAEQDLARLREAGEENTKFLHSGGRGNGAAAGLYAESQIKRITGKYPKGVAVAIPVAVGYRQNRADNCIELGEKEHV